MPALTAGSGHFVALRRDDPGCEEGEQGGRCPFEVWATRGCWAHLEAHASPVLGPFWAKIRVGPVQAHASDPFTGFIRLYLGQIGPLLAPHCLFCHTYHHSHFITLLRNHFCNPFRDHFGGYLAPMLLNMHPSTHQPFWRHHLCWNQQFGPIKGLSQNGAEIWTFKFGINYFQTFQKWPAANYWAPPPPLRPSPRVFHVGCQLPKGVECFRC